MAGHSHWAGIKRQKDANDKHRGAVFSKLLAAITAAARAEPNPDFNPRLRTAVLAAREAMVPNDNIARAIGRASEPGGEPLELTFEAYGPGGIAIIIEAIGDNRNRVVAEIKKILSDHGGRWAESGGVFWAFDLEMRDGQKFWRAKFPQEASEADTTALGALVAAINDHDDVRATYVNAATGEKIDNER
ncbi:MAG: YebC/PmpR family DNA-binding transcriptional regulator [Patescibacteria group bacterium]